MKISLLVAGAAALAGCASTQSTDDKLSERAAKRLAEFERTGEVRSCLNITRINSITPLDDYHFLVRVGVNEYYLNEVSRCSGAGNIGNRIQYEISTSQLCRNQIVTVVDNTSGIIAGSCGLGGFERLIEKTEQAD